MLEHKRVPFEVVSFLTLTHPFRARLHGFDAGGQTRSVGARRPWPVRLGDLTGTVPGLAAGPERISTNYRIARYLDLHHPAAPLLPEEPDRRAAVEDAERWANLTLQMTARRVLFTLARRDPAAFARSCGDGRMGYLLYRSRVARRFVAPMIGRLCFACGPAHSREILAALPAQLDHVDTLIADGVIGRLQPNVADFMIVPSLALMLYASTAQPYFDGRPSLGLVDRHLPAPPGLAPGFLG